MTQRHDEQARSSSADFGPREATPSHADLQRIAAELAALGEDPVPDDELAFATTAGSDLAHEEILPVATLVDLSRWQAPDEPLLPLSRQRAWRRIETSWPAPVADPVPPAANGHAGWRGVVAGLALVAGLAIVPRFDVPPPASEQERADLQQAGEAARLAIDILGDRDGERASSLAADYEARLRASRGGDR